MLLSISGETYSTYDFKYRRKITAAGIWGWDHKISFEKGRYCFNIFPFYKSKKTSLRRTNKLATLDIELILGKIGELKTEQIVELDNKS